MAPRVGASSRSREKKRTTGGPEGHCATPNPDAAPNPAAHHRRPMTLARLRRRKGSTSALALESAPAPMQRYGVRLLFHSLTRAVSSLNILSFPIRECFDNSIRTITRLMKIRSNDKRESGLSFNAEQDISNFHTIKPPVHPLPERAETVPPTLQRKRKHKPVV